MKDKVADYIFKAQAELEDVFAELEGEYIDVSKVKRAIFYALTYLDLALKYLNDPFADIEKI